LRDDFDLRASDETWEVPGCFCLEDYRGSRRVDGVVTDDEQAELTWSFDIPGPPTNCTCDTTACTLEIRQRLVREDLLIDASTHERRPRTSPLRGASRPPARRTGERDLDPRAP